MHKVNNARRNNSLLTTGGMLVPIKGHRFCEAGLHYAIKDNMPAVKGWMCKECREKLRDKNRPDSA